MKKFRVANVDYDILMIFADLVVASVEIKNKKNATANERPKNITIVFKLFPVLTFIGS